MSKIRTAGREAIGRFRKTLQSAGKRESYPPALKNHRLMPLIEMAGRRPLGSKVLQEELTTKYWGRTIDAELSLVLEEVLKLKSRHADAANLFVAATRALAEDNLERGLRFSEQFLSRLPDQRVIRSLVSYQRRAGDPIRALAMLELVQDKDWVEKRRKALDKNATVSGGTPEAHLDRYFGYRYLRSDPESAVLLYGDINLNSIDGSSVWLASVAEALAGSGIKVHFLLKANIERALLLEPLLARDDIELIEPRYAGYDRLTAQEAIRVIEALDGIVGGYRTVVLRGMDICGLAANRSSLWNRVWAYLTDFYTIDGSDGGRVLLRDGTAAAFADFRHLFSRFLVQTPQIAKVLHKEFGIEDDMVLGLPPMIPDDIEPATQRGERATNQPWRIAYAGKIAPQWGVQELISIAEQLVKDGHPIEVHLIGDKIHANSDDAPTFADDIEQAIHQSTVLTWHRGLARSETLDLMRTMDLAWCYRDPALERHTLELSTKLLECLAVQVPMVLTRSSINEQLLGEDYPLFVADARALLPLLQSLMNGKELPCLGNDRYSHAVEDHRISSVRKRALAPSLHACETGIIPRRIVLAGHDLKFIGEFESYLKKLGHMVRRDEWEWGEPIDLDRTRALAAWADSVFCEWSLANAVWYSENLASHKRLVVRLHSQEVHKAAKVFPPRLTIENVDKLVFVSDHIRELAVARFGWEDKPVSVIPNYVKCDLFDRPKDRSAAFTVAMVGCVPEMKRLDRALDFISALRKHDPRFKLVIKGKLPSDYGWMRGKTSEMSYYDQQFDRIDNDELLRDGVEFSEFSPRIAAWYQGVGCILSTSDFESFHYSVAEGAASGAMPLIWSWEGADKLFPKEWLVNDTDSAVERALETLGDNWQPELGASLYQQPIREHFDMRKVFDQLTESILGSTI